MERGNELIKIGKFTRFGSRSTKTKEGHIGDTGQDHAERLVIALPHRDVLDELLGNAESLGLHLAGNVGQSIVEGRSS